MRWSLLLLAGTAGLALGACGQGRSAGLDTPPSTVAAPAAAAEAVTVTVTVAAAPTTPAESGRTATEQGSTPSHATTLPPPAAPAARRVPACDARVHITTTRRASALWLDRSVVVRRSPHRKAEGIARLSTINRFGLPTVLLGLEVVRDADCVVRWFRAKIPRQPNGITGWVPADAVTRRQLRTRVVADLSERRLDVYRDGRRIWRIRAGIGAPDAPTPVGRFYIDARYRVDDVSGPYGPAVLAIAAYSQVPRGRWEHGLPTAIHGTNAPWTIGRAASHGCFHVSNRHLARLLALLPEGTPIDIRR